MKLDKIKFAALISYLTKVCMHEFDDIELANIDIAINVDIPEPTTQPVDIERLHELLSEMRNAKHDRFIPAIKCYRALTGMGLKEAKEAVEKYR